MIKRRPVKHALKNVQMTKAREQLKAYYNSRFTDASTTSSKKMNVPIPMKVCTKCGVEKPLGEYAWYNKKTNRRRSSCKSCNRKYYKSRKGKTTGGKIRQYKVLQPPAVSNGKITAWLSNTE